jgi:ribosomal protein S18 acetylase RimI-like enzyme
MPHLAYRWPVTDAGPSVSLRPLRDDEYAAFVEASKAGYARGIEEQGGYSRDFARRKAEDDFGKVLPNGLQTPGHAIFVVVADGEAVGRLWIAEREMGGRRALFIYDIEIDDTFRGRGLGRTTMLLAEEEGRRRGLPRIELNVFGGNEVARRLYRSLGYVENAVQMSKDLS